jgi:hypothetical protein
VTAELGCEARDKKMVLKVFQLREIHVENNSL